MQRGPRGKHEVTGRVEFFLEATIPPLPTTFGLLGERDAEYERAAAAVLPVPFQRTTSYGKGTGDGPAAIVRASQALELYDDELDTEPYEQGIATLPPFLPAAFDLDAAMRELEVECFRHMSAGKFLVTLGGEHSLTLGAVRAARRRFGDIGVVQFDAHADLRHEHDGTPFSHAAVMRRIVEAGLPTLAIGVRSLSKPEREAMRERNLPTVWARQLPLAAERFTELLRALPERVYLTFDADYFDPSLVPATGTPEPGGGTWKPTLDLPRALFEQKEVVAMDVVELAPIAGQPASDFLLAKLIYKCLGYRMRL